MFIMTIMFAVTALLGSAIAIDDLKPAIEQKTAE